MSRSLFSGTDRAAYLNTAAEGLTPASFVAALSRYAGDKALGSDGRAGMLAVERRCRERVAALLGARPDEVAFVTSCARGINAALSAVRFQPGDALVTTDLEFPTVDLAAERLRGAGIDVRVARSTHGAVAPGAVTALLDERGVIVWGRDGRLRVSIHLYNDSSDIERLLEALPQP